MKTAEEFWSMVSRGNPSDCWLWLGYKLRGGYGRLSWRGRSIGAHRLAWILANGPLPTVTCRDDAVVMHQCDNRACVNPAHLRLGTTAENIADRDMKGRQISRPVRGERRRNAKLTDAAVVDILSSPLSAVKLGRIYGVHRTIVGDIRRGKRWPHVPRPDPMPGSVRELVRDLLRMTQGEGGE